MSAIGWQDFILPLGLIVLFVAAVLIIYHLLNKRNVSQRIEQMLEEVVEDNRTEMGELLEEFQSSLRPEAPPAETCQEAALAETAQPQPPAETP